MMKVRLKKKHYPSSEQKVLLKLLLNADEEVKSGKFTSTFTREDANKRWTKIEAKLNALPGAKKTGREWRKTWQDMKAKMNKKLKKSSNSAADESPIHSDDNDDVDDFNHPDSEQQDDCDEQEVKFSDLPSTSQDILMQSSLSYTNNHETNHKKSANETQRNPSTMPKPERETHDSTSISDEMLQRSIDSILALEKEKNEIKRTFYQDYLHEMRRQTNALNSIVTAINSYVNMDGLNPN